MNSLETLQAKIADFSEMKRKYVAEMTTSLKHAFNQFFDEHPAVKVIHWTQFTPYFNDGDPCLFQVNEAVFGTEILPIDDVYQYDENGTNILGYNNAAKNHPDRTDCEKFAKILSNLEEVLLDTWGDHVVVQITHEGIWTEEYEHE